MSHAANNNSLHLGILTPLDPQGKPSLSERWFEQPNRLGLNVVLIPVGTSTEDVQGQLSQIHGLLLPGGDTNIHHSFYTPFPPDEDDPSGHDIDRDVFSMDLIEAAYDMNLPTIGICRGMQAMVVAMGGRLTTLCNEQINHGYNYNVDLNANGVRDPEDVAHEVHTASIQTGGIFRHIYPDTPYIMVNSVHFQGIDQNAPFPDVLLVEATAEDGVIEAISVPGKPMLGVQSHFEVAGKEPHDVFFNWFAKQMRAYANGESYIVNPEIG